MPTTRLAVNDHLAIEQLYARQSHAIDSGDHAGWAACFIPEGVFDSPTYESPVEGTAQLIAFAAEFTRSAAGTGVVRRHWTTALVLDGRGDGEVSARCYALVLATAPAGPPRIERSVVFHDRLVCRDGRWAIRRREVEVDGVS